MPINQNEIVDLLYKKIAFNSAKTDTQASRSASEEPIVSPVSAYGNHVWVSAGLIPGTPPAADSLIVKRQQSSDTEHIQLTVNPDVATHRSWLALTTGNASQMLNWIPPIFGSQYGLKVWVGDPTQAGSYRIHSKGTGADDQFYFDYNAGSLHFIGQNLPNGINAGSQIFIEGYRYIGSTDLSNLQATALNDLSDVTVDSVALTDGQVLQWSQNQNQWISGPVSGGAMQEFLITPPKQTGQTLVYEAVDANGVGVNKFKNEFLNYAYLDGLPGATNAHAGSFLKATATGTATNPSVMELEWQPLTDLYTPLGVIDIASSNIFHLDASRATDLDPNNPATGQDVIVTTDPSRTELPDNSSYDPNRHGAKYLADPQLWVLKTTELDKHGHVLGRVWTNLTDTLDGYVKQDDYDVKWASHESGGSPRHNLWTDLAGVHSQTQSALAREKLLIKDENNLLIPLDHSGIIISGNTLTEIHGTHVAGKAVPGSSSAPSDLDVLAFSSTQDAWVLSNIASGQGEANDGVSLSASDTDSFNIYKDKDLEFLRFRGIKVFDGNNTAITDWNHTWDNGIVSNADYPFLVRKNPSDGNTIEFKFDARKIKIYDLADRLDPSDIGYTLKQLEEWSSAEPLVNPPNAGNGANTITGKAYAEGWFSNPVDSSTPNQMTQLEWAALMGGGVATIDSAGRRLRTSHKVYYAPADPGEPTSIQQQIDDKLQYKFFTAHFTLNGTVEEVRDANFGGYYNQNSHYGYPGTVETTEGLTNPIYEGLGWAHEARGIIFKAASLSHAGQASWGDTYNNNWGNDPGPEWANHGVSKWNWGGGDETYHTVKSVITRHILAHEGNPHGVTHLEVGSETAQWNANKIQGTDVSLSGLENNHIMVWDGSQWINSNIMTQTGESNAAENIGAAGAETFSGKVGSNLQFRKLKSTTPKILIAENGNTIDFGFDETLIDITNLTNFPIDINQLGDVSGAPANGDVLTYNGSGWVPAVAPGTTDFVYDGAGVDEDFLLRAQEVMDPVTGLSQNPKKWKWVTSDKYTTASKLMGLPHSVTNVIQTGDLSINYEDIADGYIMKWNGTSWVAAVNPAVAGVGEVNRIGSWADGDLGALQSSSGTTLACTTVTLGNGSVLDVSKQTIDVDNVSTTRLMVKTVVPTAYISVDTAVSNAKEIGFTLDETQIQLDNLGGDLDPMRISPNNVNTQAFGALAGYSGMNIGNRFGDVETNISNLSADKLDITAFNLHTTYDNTLRPTDYKVGYGPVVDPGNTFGQTYIPDDPGLKHQPYEIGHDKPVFNASRIMNAPVDEAFIISDGNIGASTLDMADAGRYMQWDGYKWTIGGGGEISTGEHMQFAYYHAHTPTVNTTTQILKPVGNVLNFVEGTGLIESKLGMHTTTPHASFSIAGSSPSIGLKQIGNAVNEPNLEAGWGTLYARSSAGGITAESIIIMHFDGADGGNAFLNYGNADLFFLPQHDPDGNGVYDSVNNVRTKAERNIYGGTSGFFPGGVGDYLAAPAVDQINLAKKPFSIDFWMCPTVDTPGDQLNGKQYLCGQFDAIHNYWYLAINYEKDDTASADVHFLEFGWKEYDAVNNSAILHTRNLTRFNSESFTPDTWYHIVFQRVPSGSTDLWELLIAEAAAGHQAGVPIAVGNTGLPHSVTQIGPVVELDIDQYDSDFLIGNFCRQELVSTGNDFNSFKGYIDEFRFQIGTYINWAGLSQNGYYLSYLLPYDTGNSALIFKDDLGTHDLLNSAGIVRRLTDQDGDTRLDVDTKDNNDNTIRLITSAVEIASFSQLGMCLSNDDVRVSSIKDDLNNSFSSALVTQRAVKEALDSISTKSIEDTAGTTYVHTEETLNDQAIRMTVDGNEKLVIDSTSIDLKAPLKAYGTLGAEGEVLVVAADGSLEWGTPSAGNVDIGYSGTVTMYADDNDINLAPATGLTWNSAAGKLTAKELEIQKLKIEEGISQPGLLLYRYSTGSGSWTPSTWSPTNPTFPTEPPSVSVVPYIWCQTGTGFPHDSRSAYRARYTGFWNCQESGTYSFGLQMGQNHLGCFFFIDGQLMINATVENFNFVGCSFNAVKGKVYAVEIARYGDENQWSFADCKFQWTGPSTATNNDLTSIFETHYPVLEAAGSKRDLTHTFEVPKVGIGTNEPTEALEVIGKIKANKFEGPGSNPTGAVIAYGGNSAPEGWLLCNAGVYNRSTYSDLFSAIGTLHGAGNNPSAAVAAQDVLYLTFDNNFTDSSNSNHNVTTTGAGVEVSSDQVKLGLKSCAFNIGGATTNGLSVPASTDWDFKTGDFTIEFWVYYKGLGYANFINLNFTAGVLIQGGVSGQMNFYIAGNSIVESSNPTSNQWHHYAFVRESGIARIYRDGQETASATMNGDVDNGGALGFSIGSGDATNSFEGYLDQLVVSKGLCKYTTNFSVVSPNTFNVPDYNNKGFAGPQTYIIKT